MLKIRLKRMGSKRKPFYRIVVADVRSPRDGKFIEEVGTYNPMKDPIEFTLKEESIKKWISTGAQPTDAVNRLLVKSGIKK